MSEGKVNEAQYNKLVEKLHKSNEALASAVLSVPGGEIVDRPVEIDIDEDSFDPNLNSDDIREHNRTSVFEITSIEGRVVVLPLDRVRGRIRNKLSGWTQSQKSKGTVVNGISISTTEKFRNRIAKLVRKSEDKELRFPIKLNTVAGQVELDATQLLAIHNALETHDMLCEAKEQEVWEAINAATDIGRVIEILAENKIKL